MTMMVSRSHPRTLIPLSAMKKKELPPDRVSFPAFDDKSMAVFFTLLIFEVCLTTLVRIADGIFIGFVTGFEV